MAEPVLQTRGLTRHFGALKAVDDVSLDLRAGEIHAIIGPNGAGKSTLLKMISGELAPKSGAVAFDGRDVSGLPAFARARLGLARTFQISALAMENTVLENAMLGALAGHGGVWRFWQAALARRALVDAATRCLERVDLQDARERRVADLSHGERRQLEVAVALAQNPKALVMDEPMAGLGAEGSLRLTALLDGLRHQAPILLVEHDMDAVFALADRISVLVYGRIIATGTVDEIRADPAVRDAYLGEEA